ncbi:MAG: hypothetical protein NXI20_11095 [bacterium]|nr:hypothetical protein [bacterium]
MKELKLWLGLNAGFSTASGLVAIIFNKGIQEAFGFHEPTVLPGLGVGLILFGAYLLFVISRKAHDRNVVNSICYADAGWVIGSIVIVGFSIFQLSMTGYITISIIALIVAVFGYQQFRYNKLLHSNRS